MTTVVSYRVYCTECSDSTMVRESKADESAWEVNSLISQTGVCPSCQSEPAQSASTDTEEDLVSLEELDSIGQKAAQNLREAGYESAESIAGASDEDILDVAWVGEKALNSLRNTVNKENPKDRWDL